MPQYWCFCCYSWQNIFFRKKKEPGAMSHDALNLGWVCLISPLFLGGVLSPENIGVLPGAGHHTGSGFTLHPERTEGEKLRRSGK
jgi:hypothetical protein